MKFQFPLGVTPKTHARTKKSSRPFLTQTSHLASRPETSVKHVRIKVDVEDAAALDPGLSLLEDFRFINRPVLKAKQMFGLKKIVFTLFAQNLTCRISKSNRCEAAPHRSDAAPAVWLFLSLTLSGFTDQRASSPNTVVNTLLLLNSRILPLRCGAGMLGESTGVTDEKR